MYFILFFINDSILILFHSLNYLYLNQFNLIYLNLDNLLIIMTKNPYLLMLLFQFYFKNFLLYLDTLLHYVYQFILHFNHSFHLQ